MAVEGSMKKNLPESIYVGTDLKLISQIKQHQGTPMNTSTWQHLLAVAEWSPDTQEEAIIIYHLDIKSEEGLTAPAACGVLNRFTMRHATTALQAVSMGAGKGTIIAANNAGHLCQMVYKLPQSSYVTAEEVQWEIRGAASDADCAFVPHWLDVHKGRINAFDTNGDTCQVASAGADGAICLIDATSNREAKILKAANPAASYAALKWASLKTFVTTSGSVGGLQVWDIREGGNPTLSMGGAASLNSESTCLDTNLSRPHLCVTGGRNAHLCLWDLRHSAVPQSRTADRSLGDVTEICFDQPTEQEGHALSVLASMTNGDLLRMSTSQSKGGQIQGDYGKSWKSPMDSSKLLGLGDTINSFSVDSLNTRDVICCSSAECLVYLHRS